MTNWRRTGGSDIKFNLLTKRTTDQHSYSPRFIYNLKYKRCLIIYTLGPHTMYGLATGEITFYISIYCITNIALTQNIQINTISCRDQLPLINAMQMLFSHTHTHTHTHTHAHTHAHTHSPTHSSTYCSWSSLKWSLVLECLDVTLLGVVYDLLSSLTDVAVPPLGNVETDCSLEPKPIREDTGYDYESNTKTDYHYLKSSILYHQKHLDTSQQTIWEQWPCLSLQPNGGENYRKRRQKL